MNRVTYAVVHISVGLFGAIGSPADSIDDPPTRRAPMCMTGHLVPSVFLLGVQKAATSTQAGELVRSPDMVFGNRGKELHVFDHMESFKSNRGRAGYINLFPLCKLNDSRASMDATPYYFHSTFAPRGIRAFYSGELAGRLRFIVSIREPAQRMFSAFHRVQRSCHNAGCMRSTCKKVVWVGFDCGIVYGLTFRAFVDATFRDPGEIVFFGNSPSISLGSVCGLMSTPHRNS